MKPTDSGHTLISDVRAGAVLLTCDAETPALTAADLLD